MARLNNSRSQSTTSSLYRGYTPDQATRENSDKENDHPTAKTIEKSMMPPLRSSSQSIPLHTSSNKRRRLETPQRRIDELLSQYPQQEETEETRWYDPDQSLELRRDLRVAVRKNQQDLNENRDEFTRDPKKLTKLLKHQNLLMDNIKQTSDAALDSKVLIDATDLGVKMIQHEAYGASSLGVDIDLFVANCAAFMRREATDSQTDDDDDQDELVSTLSWNRLGRQAAFISIRRPAVPTFLLGPLAVEKKIRNTQRTGRSQRDPIGPTVEPQSLNTSDLQRNESSNATKMSGSIKDLLHDTMTKKYESVTNECNDLDIDITDPEAQHVLLKHGLCDNGDMSLFRFAINPHSFGQTVENLFYLSFLVKDGHIIVKVDKNGLPTITTHEFNDDEDSQEPDNGNSSRKSKSRRPKDTTRYQAIFSLDYQTWRKLIVAFDLKDSMITNRQEIQTQVGGGGWYA